MREKVLAELRKQGMQELNSRLEFYVKYFNGSLMADCLKAVLVERSKPCEEC